MKFIITESEKLEILNMYSLLSNDKRPLQKLMTCQFTSDGKYVVYEGNAYSTETGKLVLLNEEWSLSDILHTGADLLSVGMDFIIPGSGAIIDVLNAISYIIEAQFKNEKERDSLYIMAAITFAFVILPGPLQAIATPLKRAVKSGAGMASKVVVQGLKLIGGALETILIGIPKWVSEALKSPLAKNILGTWGPKISGFIEKFTSRIKPMLEKITGKKGVDGLTKNVVKSTDNLLPAVINKVNALSKIDNVVLGSNAPTILSKIGLSKGAKFSTPKGPIVIGDIIDVEYVLISSKFGKQKIKIWDFLEKYIVEPTVKLNGTGIPLISKSLIRIFNNDGTINQEELNKLPNITPEQSKKDMEYLSQSIAEYEGSKGKYSVNKNAIKTQKALKMLGYDLGNFGPNKDGVDGKFGPKTLEALKKFQTENNLQSSIGKMDRVTAKKIAELLKTKNIKNSEEIQSDLNNI